MAVATIGALSAIFLPPFIRCSVNVADLDLVVVILVGVLGELGAVESAIFAGRPSSGIEAMASEPERIPCSY